MKESRQQQLLQGNTGLAKKVFEFVPMQEAWSAQTINQAMRTSSSTTAAHHAVRACLGDMKDQGLIREPKPGYFQRDPVKGKTVVQPYLRDEQLKEPTVQLVLEPGQKPNGFIVKETKVKPQKADVPVTYVAAKKPMIIEGECVTLPEKGVPAPEATSIDMLTELAIELGDFASTITKGIQSFATRMEEIASRVETETAENAEKLEKLDALQKLLKSLG